jgi:hypothetical protein
MHLVGFYLLLLSLMHGTMNLKFTEIRRSDCENEQRNMKARQ